MAHLQGYNEPADHDTKYRRRACWAEAGGCGGAFLNRRLSAATFEPVSGQDGSPARVAVEARNQMKRDQAAAFQAGVPSARVVRLDNASHDVFTSNESDILRETDDFIRTLPKPGGSPKD